MTPLAVHRETNVTTTVGWHSLPPGDTGNAGDDAKGEESVSVAVKISAYTVKDGLPRDRLTALLLGTYLKDSK